MRSALAIAGLATLVAAAPVGESTSCPATITSTHTYGGKSYYYSGSTVYADPPGPTETFTGVSWVATGTTTVTNTVTPTSTTCVNPKVVTETIDSTTATSYTGDFTLSSLRPSTSCAATIKGVDYYPEGTQTQTFFTTLSAHTVTTHITSYSVDTQYFSRTADPVTVTDDACTSTVTSAKETVSTATQALKCAPTNLTGTDGIPGQRYRGSNNDGIASYGSGGVTPEGFEDRTGAHKDASACCQACQDNENCIASIFSGTSSTYPAPSEPYCQLWYNDESSSAKCGLGFTIFAGDKQIASTGCGYIAENVYASGFCLDWMSPRECEQSGLVNQFA